VILSLAFTAKLNPTISRMWQAYSFAPAIAPLSYVAWQLVFDAPGNALVWLRALYFWVPASFALGAAIAMPTAFLLRRMGKLHGLSILSAALVGSFVFSVCMAIRASSEAMRASTIVFPCQRAVTIPFALSALVFWGIAGYDDLKKWDKR
jgi:hypothetical protein